MVCLYAKNTPLSSRDFYWAHTSGVHIACLPVSVLTIHATTSKICSLARKIKWCMSAFLNGFGALSTKEFPQLRLFFRNKIWILIAWFTSAPCPYVRSFTYLNFSYANSHLGYRLISYAAPSPRPPQILLLTANLFLLAEKKRICVILQSS